MQFLDDKYRKNPLLLYLQIGKESRYTRLIKFFNKLLKFWK